MLNRKEKDLKKCMQVTAPSPVACAGQERAGWAEALAGWVTRGLGTVSFHAALALRCDVWNLSQCTALVALQHVGC